MREEALESTPPLRVPGEESHVGRRVSRAERAVEIDRVPFHRPGEPVREVHLIVVPGRDLLPRLLDPRAVVFGGSPAHEGPGRARRGSSGLGSTEQVEDLAPSSLDVRPIVVEHEPSRPALLVPHDEVDVEPADDPRRSPRIRADFDRALARRRRGRRTARPGSRPGRVQAPDRRPPLAIDPAAAADRRARRAS